MVAAQVNRDGAEGEPGPAPYPWSGTLSRTPDRVLILYVQ